MKRPHMPNVGKYVKKEAEEIQSAVKGVVDDARASWKQQSAHTTTQKLNSPPLIDPSKLKSFIIAAIKILIAVELLGALAQGFSTGDWSRLGADLVIAGILYVAWDKITRVTTRKKAEYRARLERGGEEIRLLDALAFSLLWTDEIYSDIPADRKRLVVISYTLIAIGLVVSFLRIGDGFMSLIFSGALVLAAVNLLGWVVSRERVERESLETELKLAHDVQVELMPKCCPPVPGFDIGGQSFPAKEVGGDHYDYCYLDDGQERFGISVFDVSGKGMQAAMTAVFTTGAFVTETRLNPSPADVLTHLNKAVYRHIQRGHFVAFFLGVLDVKDKRMTFSNAGQMKPLLRRGEDVQWLDSAGVPFPLGMTSDTSYEERSIQLQSGDVMLFMTDGYTEAMNTRQEEFGSKRLEDVVRSLSVSEFSANGIITRITDDVRAFAGPTPQHDDMTMVAVKVE